ncbi:MAG: response regulator transcription factor [Ignavibacterium sp.]|jgi:DNA-binding NarL/FixJ family response regulator
MKIIIADDSPIFRARLFTLLDELEDVEIVGQADSGPGALEIIRTSNPDAVIMDIRMPGLTGIQVLEEIRKTRPDLLIVMMTNYSYQQYRERCRKAGADYFFDKSHDIEKILEVFASRSGARQSMTKETP